MIQDSSILITGGSGLLAVNWAQAMRGRCKLILGLHNRNISLAHTFSKNIDLDSIDDLVRTFEEFNCRVVINTAGLASVEQCESEPSLAHYVNVILATNVAKACAKLGIQLVHISTDHLFSGQESMVSEDHPVAPINVYGLTKAEAEFKVCEINSNTLVIRTNFYGWGTSYRQSFSDRIISQVRSNKEIILFKDIFYTPILIETVALAVHELIDLNLSGIFNVVGDDRISKYEFGLIIADKFGLDPLRILPGFFANHSSLTQRPFDMSLCNSKIKKFLGRQLGSVKDQITKLHGQELKGFAKEIKKL